MVCDFTVMENVRILERIGRLCHFMPLFHMPFFISIVHIGNCKSVNRELCFKEASYISDLIQ